jgi:hypothetical protein
VPESGPVLLLRPKHSDEDREASFSRGPVTSHIVLGGIYWEGSALRKAPVWP